MCFVCDHPEFSREDALDHLRRKIDRNGWTVLCVESEPHRAPFAYTIGLHALGLPELLVSGLDPQRAAWLLNRLARQSRTAGIPLPGAQLRLPEGTLVEFVEVTHPDAHMGFAVAIEGHEIRARQVVWSDGRGRWPWSAAFDGGAFAQPVLGMRRLKAG